MSLPLLVCLEFHLLLLLPIWMPILLRMKFCGKCDADWGLSWQTISLLPLGKIFSTTLFTSLAIFEQWHIIFVASIYPLVIPKMFTSSLPFAHSLSRTEQFLRLPFLLQQSTIFHLQSAEFFPPNLFSVLAVKRGVIARRETNECHVDVGRLNLLQFQFYPIHWFFYRYIDFWCSVTNAVPRFAVNFISRRRQLPWFASSFVCPCICHAIRHFSPLLMCECITINRTEPKPNRSEPHTCPNRSSESIYVYQVVKMLNGFHSDTTITAPTKLAFIKIWWHCSNNSDQTKREKKHNSTQIEKLTLTETDTIGIVQMNSFNTCHPCHCLHMSTE